MGQLHYTATPTSCNVNYKIKAAEGGAYELYAVSGLGTDFHLYVKAESTGKAVKYGDTTFKIGATTDDTLESINTKLKEVCFIASGLGSESGAVVDAGVHSLGGASLGLFNLSDATLIL